MNLKNLQRFIPTIHFVLLIVSGVLIIILLKRGIPGFAAEIAGDSEKDETTPGPGYSAEVVNETPGVNQTYNLPNPPTVNEPDANADYLSPVQLEAALAPQAESTVQNVLSVGADYSEFVPASQAYDHA